MNDAELIIKKGYRVVFGSQQNPNIEDEASKMKCTCLEKQSYCRDIDLEF